MKKDSIHINLDTESRKRLEELAEKYNYSRSEVTREAISFLYDSLVITSSVKED